MKSQRGQTIVEILLAAAVVAVALTALVAVVTTSLNHNRMAKERTIATRQAQEALEWVRTIRDVSGSWSGFTAELDKVENVNPLHELNSLCVTDQYIADNQTDLTEAATLLARKENHICSISYIVSKTTYTRKVYIDYMTPGEALIKVTMNWGKGNLETLELNAKLYEKEP
jgi:type II secretory pathway pseudopilin PulG